MAIEIRQPGEAGLIGKAAVAAGRAKRAREIEQIALRQAEQLRSAKLRKQMAEFEAEMRLRREQTSQILDLEAEQRAKAWQIEKMEIASRTDFAREERERVRKLDAIDSKLTQLDKEKEQGRFSADETAYANAVSYWQAQKDFIETGVRPPTPSKLYGVRPAWMEFLGKEYEDTNLQDYAQARLQAGISGRRPSVVPYYLDPSYVQRYPAAARQAQEARGIFLTDEEFDAIKRGGTPEGAAPEITSMVAPIYQRNTATGQTRVSYDGGKTWRIIG